MRRIALTLAALVLSAAHLLAQGGAVEETRATLRNEALKLINADRVKQGLQPVELEPRVSVTADDYCRLQLRNRTSGHFSTDGIPPYVRYSFAGGNDGLSENTASWSASFSFNERALYEMVHRSHEAMMEEQPPHDGHRRTILDPWATHVGIGVAWERGEFRLTQHFIRRYLKWGRVLPRAASLDEKITATATPLPGYRVEIVSVHHEALPQPMTASVANSIESYKLPERRFDLRPRLKSVTTLGSDGTFRHIRQHYEDGTRGDFTVANDGSFTFPVPFHHGPGIYTVVIWVRGEDAREPIAVSNVSIQVGGPQEPVARGGNR